MITMRIIYYWKFEITCLCFVNMNDLYLVVVYQLVTFDDVCVQLRRSLALIISFSKLPAMVGAILASGWSNWKSLSVYGICVCSFHRSKAKVNSFIMVHETRLKLVSYINLLKNWLDMIKRALQSNSKRTLFYVRVNRCTARQKKKKEKKREREFGRMITSRCKRLLIV